MKITLTIMYSLLFFGMGFSQSAKVGEAPGGVLTGLGLWNRADRNVGLSGTNVTSWSDETGTNTFTVVGTPQYLSNTMNFNPVLGFNGFSYFTGNTTINNQTEFFAVGKIENPTGVNTSGALIGNNSILGYHYAFHTEGGNLYVSGEVTNTYAATNSFGNSIGQSIFNSDLSETPAASQFIRVNGKSYTNILGSDPFPYSKVPNLGARLNEPILNGSQLAEAIIYTASKNGTERIRIQSYLAVKYGISIDQTVSQDYLASNATTIWKATDNVGYINNIFGIGRDDISLLNQKVSKSIHANSILTLSIDHDFTSSTIDVLRTTIFNNNIQFLLVSDNGAATTMTQTTELSLPFNTRIPREWKVEKTANFNQTINLKFDGYGSTNSIAYFLIRDADGDFSSGASIVAALDSNGAVLDVTLNDGEYFTIAKGQFAPGGVTPGLNIWLKANEGIAVEDGASISTWIDKSSVRVNNATNSDEVSSPIYRTSGLKRINFNPTVEFDGINNGLNFGNDYIFTPAAQGGLNIFAAAKPDVTSSAKIVPFVFDFGFYANRGYGFSIGTHIVHGYDTIDYGGLGIGATRGGTSEPNLYTLDVNFGANQNIMLNNAIKATNSITLVELNTTQIDETNTHIDSSGPITIGRQAKNGNLTSNENRAFDGLLGEIIHYSANLTATEMLRVNSYLAVKYGITLEQTSPTNYLASNGTIVWNATTAGTYNNNIFGIARDDLSTLNQQISKSVNTEGIITFSTDTNFSSNNANHTAITNNFNYLMTADNGLNTQFDNYVSGFSLKHMNRIWQVQKTGVDIATVNIKADNLEADYLLVSTDPIFDATDTKIPITSGNFSNVTLNNGVYFTLAYSVCYENGVAGTPVSGKNVIISTFDAVASQSWIQSADNGMLILGSKDKGLVITRMASPETAITTPIEGMLVFDTDNQVLKLYNGMSWIVLKQKCH